MAASGVRKWLALGCLGLLGAGVLAVGVVAGIAFMAVRAEDPVDQVRRHELPSVAADEPAPVALDNLPPRSGTIVIDMGGGEIYLEPAAPGEPLNIEAVYDANFYDLEESLTGDDRWTYEVRFRLTRSGFITGIKEMVGGSQPRLRLRIPPEAPIDLRLKIKNGTADVDLGGLWVTSADFDVTQALLDLGADSPLREPVERISIQGLRGGLLLDQLNLISPRELKLDVAMAGAQVDMRGPWSRDAAVDIKMRMCDMVLRLPREARIDGLSTGRPLISTETELTLPTLSFDVEAGTRGKIRIFE